MASAPSGTLKLKKKNLPKIESTVYSNISLNEQVVFAIHYLEQHGVAVSVEEVVSTCFRLFPQSFSLKHYTRWPDSALVIRRLNDAREKGFVKGNPLDGFALKYSGVKLAERTAKTLGLVKPAPKKKATAAKPKASRLKTVEIKKRAPAPRIKEAPRKKPVVAALTKALSKPQPKTAAPKQVIKSKVQASGKVVKKAVVEVPVVKKSPAKPRVAKKKELKKTIKPGPVLSKQVVQRKPKDIPLLPKQTAELPPVKGKKDKTRKAQPLQMAMTLPVKEAQPEAKPVKKILVKKKPAPPLTRLQTIQPEMVIPAKAAKPVSMPVVSKEERVKAERIVRAMEKSDAYKLYSRNGHGAKPSEFDFRNMLFATMESTPETLVRNVNLFKGSAAIQNRQDLIKFLDDCEANFAHLLKPSVRKVSKKK
jgi:hypothetical protein